MIPGPTIDAIGAVVVAGVSHEDLEEPDLSTVGESCRIDPSSQGTRLPFSPLTGTAAGSAKVVLRGFAEGFQFPGGVHRIQCTFS